MANRDLLQPFYNADKNREETFLIEASGFLYNKAAHIIISMLMNYDRYIDQFPNIEIFKGMTAHQIFEVTKCFSSLEALNQMSRIRISPEMPEEEIVDLLAQFKVVLNQLEENDIGEYFIMPIFVYGLTQIIKEACCKKIYICNPERFTLWEMEYLRQVFGPKIDKIELVVGDPYELYKERHKELTTVFFNDICALNNLKTDIENGSIDPEIVNMQLFCIRVTNDIIEEKQDLGVYHYTCSDLIDEYEKSKIHISVMPTLAVNDNDNGKIVSAI